MLLKMDCFIKFFGGRFAEVEAEDSYIGLKLLSEGRNVESWIAANTEKEKWRASFMEVLLYQRNRNVQAWLRANPRH
jgi:hypothetical protein